jgi:predicted O-linked N-acetylglucosamine transferase (SPINDLY family)
MGVPLITLAGRTTVGRAAAGALQNLGLSNLIAATREEYVSLAIQLAQDIQKLSELRSTLRTKMQNSPSRNAAQFAKEMETLYRRVAIT